MINDTLFDQYGQSHLLPGDYTEFPHFYRLSRYSGNGAIVSQLSIREPVGWDKLKLTLTRSQDWFGLNDEFTDAKNPVEFDGNSGRDWIEDIFRAEGEDAVVTLQNGIVAAGVQIVEYEGRLNLSTRKKYRNRISCLLERKSLQSKLLARWETVNALGTQLQVPLTSQTLTETFINNVAGGKKVEQTFSGDTNGHVWIQFDTSKPQTAEIEEFAAGRPNGLSELEGPVANDEWLFKFRSSGTFTVNISLQYRVWFAPKKRTISIGAARVTYCSLTTNLTLLRLDGTKQDFELTLPQVIGNAGTSEVLLLTPVGDFNQVIEVKKGDRLYLYGLLHFGHNKNELAQTQVEVQYLTTRMNLKGVSKNANTSADAITIYDALNASVELATNYFDRIRTSFYGLKGADYAVSGSGSERVLTNGFAIRQFKTEDHPIAVSLRDLLSSLQAIDGIGISFSTELNNGAPVDVVHIKPIEEYYRPVELLRLDSVADYKEESIESELYSTLEVGFSKWIEEGSNALEEVHTTYQATTPFRHEAAKKTLISKLLTSTLAIERTRREQFVDSPKDGTTYDDDVFLIQCKPIPGYSGPFKLYQDTFIGYDIIELPTALTWLTPGMTVFIIGSAQNDYPYKVTFVSEKSHSPWTFYVDGGSVFSPENVANGQIKASQLSPLIPEVGADLTSATGLTAADTAYNLRLTPGRMLIRTAPMWAGCLVDKTDGEQVFKSKIPQNSKLVTVIADADPIRLTERNAVDLAELRPRLLFRPRKLTFSCRLSRQQMQRLRLGLTGLLPAEVDANGDPIDPNYGYVSLLDSSGIRVAGYVDVAEWLTTDEKVVLTLRQTALDLNDTTSGLDCAQFAGWTLEQAQNADDRTRRRIELCRYIDVDLP